MVELGTASSDADFEDVYQFWYDIYVGEMGRHLHDPNTCHQNRRLFDPLATAGSLCVARKEGNVVGTVLLTPVAHPAANKYRELYGLTELPADDLAASTITTKLMVAPAQRRTRLPLRLAITTFNWGLHVGFKHNYIDCNDHLVKLFTRLGYARHLPTLHLKEYGSVNSLRLSITDEEYLRNVDSPFLSILRRYQRQQGLIPGANTNRQAEPESVVPKSVAPKSVVPESVVPESIVKAFEKYRPQPLRGRPVRTPVSHAS